MQNVVKLELQVLSMRRSGNKIAALFLNFSCDIFSLMAKDNQSLHLTHILESLAWETKEDVASCGR